MTKYLITILLLYSCSASGQTQSAYDKILTAKIASQQVAITNLQAQVTALITQVADLKKQIALKDTVHFDTSFIVSPVRENYINIYLKK